MQTSTGTGEVIRAGELEIRPSEYLALAGGRALTLSLKQLELLAALARREGRIVRREELYETVWGAPMRADERSVDVYVHKLRSKLAEALPGVDVHPHALRVRLPVPAGAFTRLSQDGHRSVTGVGHAVASLALDMIEERGNDDNQDAPAGARAGAGARRRRVRRLR